jgi:integrase
MGGARGPPADEQQMIWHVCFKTDALAPSRSGDEDETFTGAQISLIDVACCQGGNLTGKPAAGSTQRRKRSVFYNALGYAVEQGHLPANPVDRIQWTTPAVAQTVDRRVVVSPAQARDLLAAVRGLSGRGEHLEAFYACLYYAALRPSEAVMLRESDLHLPRKGWGRIVLAASASRAGTAWFEPNTCHYLRKRPLGCGNAARRAVSFLSRHVSGCVTVGRCAAVVTDI